VFGAIVLIKRIFALACVLSCALAGVVRAGAQEVILQCDPAQAAADFTLGDSLHTVKGSFSLKSGEIHFDPSKGSASGAIVVDALSGESGNEGRDKKMHREILESPKFSEVVFVPIHIEGTVAPQGTSQVAVSGIMKLHGQDHEMILNFALQPGTSGQEQATTRFSVPYVKWGLKNPSTFILRVSDSVDIDVHASGQLTSAPSRY